MAKPSKIDQEQVRAACVEVSSKGLRVTLNAVFDAMGRKGSIDIVRRYWREWLGENDAITIPDAPDDFNDALRAFASTAWSAARAAAEQSLKAEREVASQDVETARASAAAAITQAEERINQAEGARQATELRLSETVADLTRTSDALRDANRRIGELEAANMIASSELQQSRAENATLNKRLDGEIRSHNARVESLEKSHADALKQERERYDGERLFLQTNTDNLRQDMERRIAESQNALRQAKAVADEASKRSMEQIEKLNLLNERMRYDWAQATQGLVAIQEEARLMRISRDKLQEQVTRLESELKNTKASLGRKTGQPRKKNA